jgi:NAD(P)H-dependent FMN reductase
MSLTTRTRILVFAGSIRSGSLSAMLAGAAAKELALADADVTLISLADYPLPIFNGDIEEESGIPENATRLAKLIAANQGVFIATPEYNHSLPPLLKNAIDWISRHRHTGTIPYRHKVYAVGSASDGMIGGARALIELRKVLTTGVRGIMVPEKIEVSNARSAFGESGELVDEAKASLLRAVCRQLIDLAARLAD